MRIKHALKLAINGVSEKPTRTALTLTGIAIGIASVMIIMSMGAGAQNLILSEIEGFGAEMITIRPGKEPSGLNDFSESLLTETLNDRDITALKRKENVPHLEDIVPQVLVPGSVTYEGESYRPTIVGGDAEFYTELLDFYPEEGRLFDEQDIRDKAQVAVIGHKVKEELFGDKPALGERITISGKKLEVIGIYGKYGAGTFFNYDEMVVIPYTTANTYLLGKNHYHEVIVRVTDAEYVKRSVRDIDLTLRETHDLDPDETADFNITTQEAIVGTLTTVISTLTIFLVGVVAVALVVGGVGIMNIMLVSVTERTREIGLRKAVGATEKDIMLQFLFEAILVTFGGGVIGVIAGGVLSYIIGLLIQNFSDLNWTFSMPLGAVLLALIVSTGIGLVFGIYPARKAAERSPMDALRYE